MPPGFGLSLEQPAWDPKTKRFFTSIPIIANNPSGCNYGQLSGPITCHGGVLVIDPKTVTGPTTQLGAFNPATNTGVIALTRLRAERRLGWTGRQHPARLHAAEQSERRDPARDQRGQQEADPDRRHHRVRRGMVQLGRRSLLHGVKPGLQGVPAPGGNCAAASQQTAVLGVIDAKSNTLIEKIPQSSGLAFGGGRFQAQPDLRSAGCTGCGRHRRRHDHRWTQASAARPPTDASRSSGIRSRARMTTTATMMTTMRWTEN